MRQDDSTVRKAEMAEDVERDIRMALWNAGMNGGMGQDLSLAFIRRAMDEPTMKRALATLESSPADGDGGVRVSREAMIRAAKRAIVSFASADDRSPEVPALQYICNRDVFIAEKITDAIRALTPTETGEVG